LADQSYAYIPTKSLCGYPGASHALPFGAQSYANIDVKSLCGYPRRVKCHHFFELDCMQISIHKITLWIHLEGEVHDCSSSIVCKYSYELTLWIHSESEVHDSFHVFARDTSVYCSTAAAQGRVVWKRHFPKNGARLQRSIELSPSTFYWSFGPSISQTRQNRGNED
jgi:hypothetical protein